MKKELHYYLMANANGDLVRTQAKRNRSVEDLRVIVEDNFINVEFISKSIFIHVVEGKKVITLLRRVVSSGNKDSLYAKRVQVIKKDVDRLVNDIICVYQFNGAVVFLRSTNPDSLDDLPSTITNLFWIKIGDISQVIKERKSKKIVKKSRRKMTEIIMSIDPKKLYINLETTLESNEEDLDFDILPIEPESDYIPIKSNVPSEIKADKVVGRFGEELIYQMLLEQNEELMKKIKKIKIKNLVWQNQLKESYMPFDITADELHIEVKSSKNDGTFIMSSNEKDILDDEEIEYNLIKVDDVNIEDKTFGKITVYSRKELQEMNFKEMKTFTVREKK